MSGAGVGHLSIGEVLELVREDFPDVTISKIRFLESQGLIAPERTAAGYRKFYDSDIERLRWILRQQRDHFLPLKVIRKMLDQGVDVSPEAQPTLWSSAASGPASGEEADADTGADEDAESQSPGRTIDVTDSGRAKARSEAEAEAELEDDDRDRTTYRSPAHPAVASARPKGRGRATNRSSESGAEPAAEPAERQTPAAEDPSGAEERERRTRPTHSTPADVVAALQEDPRASRAPRRQKGGPAKRSETEPAGATSAEGDVRMTRSELCEASGLSPEMLDDLEQYGLLEPSVLGGDAQYDREALEIARVAVRYAELGVEARHLRMYKVAAEREAGFIEQLVVPLLKQRNPAAREQAEERAEELQRMGAELHAWLLKRRLDPNFRR